MKILLTLLPLLIAVPAAADPVEDAQVIVERLAGPESRGRAATTDLAATEQWLAARLDAFGDVGMQTVEIGEVASSNLYLLREPAVEGAGWIVVGAHYDGLGIGEAGSPHDGQVYHGADDNASGVATLMLALEMLPEQADRGLAIVFFTGEEQGLLGSKAFLESGPVARDDIKAMINLDTVGRLDEGELTVFGVGSARIFGRMLEGLNSVFDLPLQPVDQSSGASDDMPFVEAGIPALHLFTGAWPEYHRPSDTSDTVDYEGIAVLSEFLAEMAGYLASADTKIEYVEPEAAAALADPEKATEGKRKVSFGSIPDFKFTGEGVKLSGVLPGTPAAQAGLQEGDVITGFGGAPVSDLTDYSEAMKLYAPGDVVVVDFTREGEPMQVEVTLTERR
jgi:Zn-dependent M28 family amino/carboxypeptidase